MDAGPLEGGGQEPCARPELWVHPSELSHVFRVLARGSWDGGPCWNWGLCGRDLALGLRVRSSCLGSPCKALTGVTGDRDGDTQREASRVTPGEPKSSCRHRDAGQEDFPRSPGMEPDQLHPDLGLLGLQSKRTGVVLGRSLYFMLRQPQEARTEAWSLWGSKRGQQATHTQICQNWAPLQLPQPPAPPQPPDPSGGWAESSQAAGLTPWTWEEGRPPAPWSGLSGAAAVWWEAGGVTGLPTAPQDVPEPPSHGQGWGCQQAGRELCRPWGASLSPRAPLYPGTRGWPGAPLPSCSATTFLGTPAPLCWSPGTGWACQAPGSARGKGQLVLHARRALWCFLETEVHAILVEPLPAPSVSSVPVGPTARLSAAGSSPQKGTGVGDRSGFRLGGGRRKELPTPTAAAGDQDAPRVHCPPHTHLTSELASPHPSAPAPAQTLPRVARGRLLRPGLCQTAA